MYRFESVWDREDAVGVPDGAVAEAAIVEVVLAVLFYVTAELVPVFDSCVRIHNTRTNPKGESRSTGNTIVTTCANTMRKSKPSTIPSLQRSYTRTNSSHEANALMSKDLVGLPEVLVCSAEARSYGLDEDFIVLEGLGDFVGDDVALRGAAEDIVCNAHIEIFERVQCVKEWDNVVEGRQNDAFIDPTRGRPVLAGRPAGNPISMAILYPSFLSPYAMGSAIFRRNGRMT